MAYLDFEKPLADLERRIEAAKAAKATPPLTPPGVSPDLAPSDAALPEQEDPAALEAEHKKLLGSIYANLGPWETVRVARVPNRPQTRDYIRMICRDFAELHGDRRYGDDPAMVTGFGRIGSVKCLLVGHQKGRDTQERISCHFGCAHPEGYRKALAKMKLAEKFKLPIVTLVDTPGAYPGLGAEQRGQAEAIAVNMLEMSRIRVPIVSVVIGEGGSGGALGIAVADRVAMLQFAWYSVISPEGCAAILWKQANEQTNAQAARALKLTAKDNLSLGIVDDVVPEPLGGAHRDPVQAAANLEKWISTTLLELKDVDPDVLVDRRYNRFRKLGSYLDRSNEPIVTLDSIAPLP